MVETEYFVHGMHCAACEILIEDKLSSHPGISKVKASLKTCKVYICSDEDVSPEELSKLVEDHGYKISASGEVPTKTNLKELLKGLGIASGVFGAFLLLQTLGLVNLINPKQVTLPFIFLIGIVASLSTCMAVVGGLVLSLSSNFAREKNYLPLVAFHVSRILGFFLLGGLIGLLGSAFILNGTAYLIMDIVLFIIMSLMGLNLLNVFKFTKKFQPKAPKFLGKHVLKLQNQKGILPAALMGAATFILPCGFTQSMQIYSLSRANFVEGALTMLIFSLGTLPMLSLISFASFKIKSKTFFMTAGFLILMFAVFNFISGLIGLGIIQL
jgi:sulfite exporter TauE/SafE/copper chaperone CopZ